MADQRELIDAISRIGARTGDAGAWMIGLTSDDIATAVNLASSPAAIDAVLAKIRAAHGDVFGAGEAAGHLPQAQSGAAADAIRSAEMSLARQTSAAAQVDLQVVTAVLNAHAVRAGAAGDLVRLQSEIESAVATRTDLDTPAGARAFQRYLIGKLRDIRSVIETAELDATSKAALSAALASLYAVATPPEQSPPTDAEPTGDPGRPAPDRSYREPGIEPPNDRVNDGPFGSATDLGFGPAPEFADAATAPAAAPPASAPTPATPASPMATPSIPLPSLGGMPDLGGGLLTPSGARGLGGLDEGFRDHGPFVDRSEPVGDTSHHVPAAEQSGTADGQGSQPDDTLIVPLPDGDTVVAPSPELARVITAAVSGTPIPDAFAQQGITIPAPGSPVIGQVDPARLVPGDVGVFADRHALALGSGKVLLDNRIQPSWAVSGPGFLGWTHPNTDPDTATRTAPAVPEVPAPAPSVP